MKYYLMFVTMLATILIMVGLLYRHIKVTETLNQGVPLQSSYSIDTSLRKITYGRKSQNTAIGINATRLPHENKLQGDNNNSIGYYQSQHMFGKGENLYDSFGNAIPQHKNGINKQEINYYIIVYTVYKYGQSSNFEITLKVVDKPYFNWSDFKEATGKTKEEVIILNVRKLTEIEYQQLNN